MIAPPRPPSPDELEALIKEARARQLRRRLLAAAGVAIAAAVSLGVYAVVTGGKVDRAQEPQSAGRASASLCRASQLSASAGWQGATQSMLGGAGITNTSDTACSLPAGRPAVRITWQGRTLTVRERGPSPVFPVQKARRVIEPHATATIYLQWWNYCGRAVDLKVPPVVYLRFGNRLVVRAPGSEQWGVPYCNGPRAPSTLFVSGPRITN
jgi:hypothetical protein